MKITEIRMREINNKSLKAVASITIDDCFVVHGLRLIEGDNGLFMAMPSRQAKNGEFFDVAHPIVNDFRLELEEMLLNEYENFKQDEED